MLHMFSSLYSKQIIYYHQPKELIKIGVYHLLFCEQKVTFPSLVWSLAASLTGCEVLQLVQLGTAETWSYIEIFKPNQPNIMLFQPYIMLGPGSMQKSSNQTTPI